MKEQAVITVRKEVVETNNQDKIGMKIENKDNHNQEKQDH